MKRLLRAVAFLTAAAAIPASAQVWDFTGNNLLNGTYVFREVIYVPNNVGSVTRAIAVFGNIVFTGNGSYTITGNVVDSGAGSGPFTTKGTYSIAPNGYGFMTHPYATSGAIHGMVSNGVFVGSSTENGVNDVMIAVPLGSAGNGTLSGNYTMDYYTLGTVQGQLSGAQENAYVSIAQLNANGNGNIGTVPVKTYLGATGSQPVNQNETGVTYSFASGIGTLRFPTTTNLAIQGNKEMYISADGNFIFGGSRTGYDLFVGVRRGTPPRLAGLYYTTGINHIPGSLDTYYGAFTATGTVILEHQRFLSTANGFPSNYTAVGVLPGSPTSDYTDTLSAVDYTISQDASIRIGVGQTPYLGLRLAVRGPTFEAPNSSAPFINPIGVISAPAWAPFTAGVAPGELLSIFGNNLSSSTIVMQGGIPFPKKLGDVRVLMNNREAAIYYVSPGQISAIVPYGTTEGVVQIQVERNGVLSNPVTAFRYNTSPGVFSLSQTGEGIAIATHGDGSYITESSPARPGETIVTVLTGIGPVFPSVADGAIGGSSSLNQVAPGTVKAYVDNLEAEVSYAGLAPFFAGLYQINLKVPDNASTGNVFLDIATQDSYTSQVALPVGTAQASQATPRSAAERPFVWRR